MRIIVTHLTRMSKGYICTAGIDADHGGQIRPLPNHRLKAEHLRSHGGIFEIGALVDLGHVRNGGRRPEFEDRKCWLCDIRHVRRLDPREFHEHLLRTSHQNLSAIFGPDLHPNHRKAVVPAHNGLASLGHLRNARNLELTIDSLAKVRLHLEDGTFSLDIAVTDVRLYNPPDYFPRREVVEFLSEKIRRRSDVILAVGLSRPFSPSEHVKSFHWLQVNNIHTPDDPLGLSLEHAPANPVHHVASASVTKSPTL
jgi:hypothetical protein